MLIAFDIFSVNIIEDSNHTLHKEWTLQPEWSQSACFSSIFNLPECELFFVATIEASACTRTALLFAANVQRRKDDLKNLNAACFPGHWKSKCTFSDNYVFLISLLAWIFPAFTSVEVLHTFCSQISRPPINALKIHCMYKLCNA